jgi:hypothetical protein
MFKMPVFGYWATVVGPKYVDEIARAPESSLSFRGFLNDVSRSLWSVECINNKQQLQLELLIGREVSHDQIHLALIRTLNRNLDPIYVEIADETESAIQTELAKGKELNGMGITISPPLVYH